MKRADYRYGKRMKVPCRACGRQNVPIYQTGRFFRHYKPGTTTPCPGSHEEKNDG